MAVTLHRPITSAHIETKLTQIATTAGQLFSQVNSAKLWFDDVLTDEHFTNNLIVDEQGQPLSAERLDLYRETIQAMYQLAIAANATRPNGGESVGKLIRPYQT